MTTAPTATEHLSHFRQLLARREAELAQLLRHCNFAAEEGDGQSDFKVLAQHAAVAAIEDAQAARAIAELKDIRSARQRMALGEYGTCVDCGEAIDPRRLEALPATAYCSECSGQEERGRRAIRTAPRAPAPEAAALPAREGQLQRAASAT